MSEATGIYDILRQVGALNDNTELVLFFLK